MSRGRGRARWAAAALLVAAAGSGCGAPAPAPTPIEIMVVGAFHGPGQGSLRSVRLAVDMADRRGGVLGHPVRLLEADDGGAAGAAIAAAERACTDQGVVAVISEDSGAALTGVSRALFGCGLPLLVTSGAEPPPSFTNVFRLLGTPAEQGALIGSWMEMKLRPGEVYLAGEASDPELEGVREGLAAAGVRTGQGPPDAAAVAPTVGAVFVAGPAGAAPFLATLRRAHPEVPVVGGPVLAGDAAFQAAASGPVYMASAQPSGPTPQRYRQAYAAAYGRGSGFDPLSCQAALLALAAVGQAGTYSGLRRATVMDGIRDPGPFRGLFDFPLDFDSTGGLGGLPLWISRLAPKGPSESQLA